MTDGMIDWLYQSTLDISILLVLILLIRNPVRRLLGAHISYWLWSLPLIRLLISDKFDRPDVITKHLKLPESSDIIPVYSGPIQASEAQTDVIVIIWLLGFAIWSVVKVTQALKFKSLLLKHSEALINDQIIAANLLEKFNPNVQTRLSSAVNGPLITGLFKPTIYLPLNFFEIYDANQRQFIFEHELTHAKRLDIWAQFLGEIFKAVFWFNPLVHFTWTKFQQDQELACDHQVLKHADLKTRLNYGKTLKQGFGALLTPNSLTFFNHKHERFIMLSKHKTNMFINLSGFVLVTTIGLLILTKTGITFAEKSIEKNGGIVSFKFNDIPLSDIATLMSYANQDVNLTNLNLLQDTKVTAYASNVHSYDFLQQLLEDNGFKVERKVGNWEFSKL